MAAHTCISMLGRLRQESLKYEASLDYTIKCFLKKRKTGQGVAQWERVVSVHNALGSILSTTK